VDAASGSSIPAISPALSEVPWVLIIQRRQAVSHRHHRNQSCSGR
jgi:hypothetical protein